MRYTKNEKDNQLYSQYKPTILDKLELEVEHYINKKT